MLTRGHTQRVRSFTLSLTIWSYWSVLFVSWPCQTCSDLFRRGCLELPGHLEDKWTSMEHEIAMEICCLCGFDFNYAA